VVDRRLELAACAQSVAALDCRLKLTTLSVAPVADWRYTPPVEALDLTSSTPAPRSIFGSARCTFLVCTGL
jgi:hypothetical protein